MTEYTYYITPEEYEEANKNGISSHRVNVRVRSFGWRVQDAITKPVEYDKHKRYREIAKENGISAVTYRTRVNRSGWSPERAATTPVLSKRESAEIGRKNYKHKYPPEILKKAKENGISYSTFVSHVNKMHWNVDKAATTSIRKGGQRCKWEQVSKGSGVKVYQTS